MDRATQFAVIIFTIVLLNSSFAIGQNEPPKKPWTGKLRDGTEITDKDLWKIIHEHYIWMVSSKKKGKKADLSGAILNDAYIGVASLAGANLSGASLRGADLKGGQQYGVNLSKADLSYADLSWTELDGADLSGAILIGANLRGSSLGGVDLSGAILLDADLSGVDIRNAVLTGCYLNRVKGFPISQTGEGYLGIMRLPNYEPKPGSVPDIPSMAGLPNLEQLTFKDYPHGLVDLREGFKRLGYKEQERKITYALKHTATKAELASKDLYKRIEGLLSLYLFEYTSKWGMSPGRPLFILLCFMFLFSFIYMSAIIGLTSKDGIWKVWIPERVRKDLGTPDPELLFSNNAIHIWGYGLYFSLLSATNIGWRELNVGNWIARIQPREFTLRASGWVRAVSGIQSLISVYLLALAVLTYFGRPFDQF